MPRVSFKIGPKLNQRSQYQELFAIWMFPKMVGFPNKPMGFPTKNDHFGVFWGYYHFWKHPYGHG